MENGKEYFRFPITLQFNVWGAESGDRRWYRKKTPLKPKWNF